MRNGSLNEILLLSEEARNYLPLLDGRPPERACIICGGGIRLRFLKCHGFNFSRCKKCGTIFCNPRLSEEESAIFFNSTYYMFLFQNIAKRIEARDGLPLDSHLKDSTLEWVISQVTRTRPLKSMRILDVGCGTGGLLYSLHKIFGVSGFGIDLSDQYVELWRKYGISAKVQRLSDHLEEGHSYDLVFSSEVIEHVPDPKKMFEELVSALSPAGNLVITTPNIGRIAPLFVKNILGWISPPNHINLITLHGLSLLAKQFALKSELRTFGGDGFSVSSWERSFDYCTDQSPNVARYEGDTIVVPKEIYAAGGQIEKQYVETVIMPTVRGHNPKSHKSPGFHRGPCLRARLLRMINSNTLGSVMLRFLEQFIQRVDGKVRAVAILGRIT